MTQTKKDIVIMSCPIMEPIPPMAPVLLSACLKEAGFSSIAKDLNIDFFNHFKDSGHWGDIHNLFAIGHVTKISLPRRVIIDILKFIKQYLLEVKKQYDPEYIGLSIFTSESVDFSILVMSYIKKYLPEVKIVLGGRGLENHHGLTDMKHYEMYDKFGMADLIVVGDAETSLIDALTDDATGIYMSKQQTKEDLDRIPSPYWDDYDLATYNTAISSVSDNLRYMGITASKGCVRKCTFCDVANFWPKYIFREGTNVARDIIHSYKSTGITNFFFTDNLMNGSVTNFRKMNEMLAREIPREIEYQGYAIFRQQKHHPKEDFELAARAGSKRWIIGVESGSEKIRNEMRKKFSNEDIMYTANELFRNDIVQSWLFIVGYPSETEEDFQETLELLKQSKHLGKDGMLRINVTPPYMHIPTNNINTDPDLRTYYGLTDLDYTDALTVHFWKSELFPDNDFLVRVDRWRRLIQTSLDLGLTWHDERLISKWKNEIDGLERVYLEKYKGKDYITPYETKVINIHQVYPQDG